MDFSDQRPIDGAEPMRMAFVSHSALDAPYLKRHVVPMLDELHLPFHLFNRFTVSNPKILNAYRAQITRNIHRCSVFLVGLSPLAVASEWVRYEVGQAFKAGKSVVRIVLADHDLAGMDERLAATRVVDFRPPNPRADELLAVLRGLDET